MEYDEFILASDGSNHQERRVMVGGDAVQLEGVLSIPEGAQALVVIAYERMGNSEYILDALYDLRDASPQAALATLLVWFKWT